MTFNQEDKIISAFLESIGPWRDYVVIGGGFALFVYKQFVKTFGRTFRPIKSCYLFLVVKITQNDPFGDHSE